MKGNATVVLMQQLALFNDLFSRTTCKPAPERLNQSRF